MAGYYSSTSTGYRSMRIEPSLEPPVVKDMEEEVACYCEICGEAIHYYENAWDLGFPNPICESCIDKAMYTIEP